MKKTLDMTINPRALRVILATTLVLTASGCAEKNMKQNEKVPQSSNIATPVTSGLSHLGLTVKDLEATTHFFVDTLGWKRAGGNPDYPAIFVTDGAIFVTLWQTTDPETAINFNRKTNIGLHHLALKVSDIETLEALHQSFKLDPKVRIEFGPELNGSGPTVHMMVYEPSGSRIEFTVTGGRKRGE